MGYGIGIYGPDGEMVIDENYQCYALVFKDSDSGNFQYPDGSGGDKITSDYPYIRMFQRIATFPQVVTTQEPPIVQMRASGSLGVSFVSMRGSAGNWTGFSYCTEWTNNKDSVNGNGVNYWVYAPMSYAINNFNVYPVNNEPRITVNDNSGRLVFDSRIPILRYRGLRQWSIEHDTDSQGNVSVDADTFLLNFPSSYAPLNSDLQYCWTIRRNNGNYGKACIMPNGDLTIKRTQLTYEGSPPAGTGMPTGGYSPYCPIY